MRKSKVWQMWTGHGFSIDSSRKLYSRYWYNLHNVWVKSKTTEGATLSLTEKYYFAGFC